MVNGLLYLHSHGILHRDLTLGNLLLTKNMDVVSFILKVPYDDNNNDFITIFS